MKECKEYREMIQSYIAGEISPSDLDSLYHHCRTCPDCGQLWEVHSNLAAAGEELPEPPEDGLLAMRANVLARISRDEGVRAGRVRWWDLGALLRARPAVALPMAAALVVVSVVAGRWSAPAPDIDDDVILQEITRQASQEPQAGLIDYWDTPMSYSNVNARPAEGGNLDLSFDVVRHVRFVTPKDSPVAREVLMHAILEPSAAGTRIKAMEFAPEIMDPRLQEALVFTMHNDPNLAVRMEAMSVLSRGPYDDAVQQAFLTTLREDQEVQMRLKALEHLAARQVNMNTIRRAIEEPQLESDTAVLQYATELIGRQ